MKDILDKAPQNAALSRSNPFHKDNKYIKPEDRNKIQEVEDSEKKIKKQKNDFLKLLMVQLKNQDPTNPMDTNEMSAQIFQMSEIEQLLEINKKLGSMNNAFQENAINSGLNFLGKGVKFKGHTVDLKDGKAELEFEVDPKKEYNSLQLKVISPDGMIHQETLPPEKSNSGRQVFDLKLDPEKFNNGIYKYYVEGIKMDYSRTDNNKTVDSLETYGSGLVDSFEYVDGKQIFNVHGGQIEQKDIIKTLKARDIEFAVAHAPANTQLAEAESAQ